MYKLEDQLELTLKNSKPYFSPWMREKNRSFKGLLWGQGSKLYNWVLDLGQEHE